MHHSIWRSTSFRLLIFLSITWVLLSSAFYFAHVGASEYPEWTTAWHKVVPYQATGAIYDSDCTVSGNFVRHCNYGVSPLGYSLFVGLPLLAMWLAWFGLAWVFAAKRVSEK